MNILYGFLDPTLGTVKIRGEEVELRSPQDAIIRGVGMVHQHFKLIPPLTVTENVILGLEPILRSVKAGGARLSALIRQGLPMNIDGAAKRIAEIAAENGLHVDPYARIEDISVGLQQRVEIIKTLYREADILILDEPTSVLTPQEVDELFVTLERFRQQGKTIILITHKLREPMALCDRISVLRDGELVGTVEKVDTSPEDLAKMMVGRPVVFRVEKPPGTPGEEILHIEDLHVADNRGLPAVKGITLSVRAGEIFGIAGVEGNGQTELVEAITGLRKPRQGFIQVEGQDISFLSPRRVREAGVSHIPEDRHARGLILPFTIVENLALGRHYLQPFATGPGNAVLNLEQSRTISEELVKDYSIKLADVDDSASTLSGGNQQKVVVARELSVAPKLVVAAQPTRGLDVGATEYIHKVLIEMRNAGVAILLVSAELDEIRTLADRIGVIYSGQLVAVKDPDETDAQELGLLMAGHGTEVSVEQTPERETGEVEL
jgi:simple sugar transport system ATP-binding protein